MGLVLDTSILIAAEREKFDLDSLFSSLPNGGTVFMASITLSELWHGFHRGKDTKLQHRRSFIRHIETRLPVLPFRAEEALVHAEIWADLEKAGQRIGLHDLIIAATAITHHHTVATLNVGEFKRIPDLDLLPIERFIVR